MNLYMSVNCSTCLNEFELDMKNDTKSITREAGRIAVKMKDNGWLVGFNQCFCPKCVESRKNSDINCHRCKYSSYHDAQLYCEFGDLKPYDLPVNEFEVCKNFKHGEHE